MRVLLNDGSAISDDAAQQRRVVGLPIDIRAIEEDDGEWVGVINEADEDNPIEYKWVHSRVGPIRIKDRAAMSLKSAGFRVAANNQKVKQWQKIDNGNVHKVVLKTNGQWMHQAVAQVAPEDAIPKNMARGEGHQSLVRHMDMSKEFQFSAVVPTETVVAT